MMGAACGLALVAPSRAGADPIALTAGVTITVLDGEHATASGVEHLAFVPLPLFDLDARRLRTSLHLEALPPLTFGYGPTGSMQQTQLSLINVAVRQSVGGGAFAGIGQTVYNQRTTYPVQTAGIISRQASRVTGLRFEAGVARRIGHHTALEYVFAVNPAMRGLERTTLRTALPFPDLLDAERAVQVDTALRFATPLGRGTLVYGLRYLNYASRYDRPGLPVDGAQIDRNAGLMPLAGYRVRM